MALRYVVVLCVSVSLLLVFGFNGPAHAGADPAGTREFGLPSSSDDQPAATTKTKKKKKATQKKSKKKKKAVVKKKTTKKKSGLSRKARGSLRALETTLATLDREAEKDDLQSFTSNIKKIAGLRIGIDTMFDELEDTKHRNDPNQIYQKLKKWSQQKNNKKRAYFARNLLRAIATERQYARALDAMDKYNKARRAGKSVEALEYQVEYEKAQENFSDRVQRIPPKLRSHLFDPLPKKLPLLN